MNFHDASHAIAQLGKDLHGRGWVPATSGNFSLRLDDGDVAITASGKDKGRLAPADIMRIDLDGASRENRRSSAETALHTQLYRHSDSVRCVLHTHSVSATLVSQLTSDALQFENLEILKAFTGIDTHAAALRIPVFANTQDIDTLAALVERHMQAHGLGVAYLIQGHGVYTWGADTGECLRHLEALEYLFDYHWRSRA